MKNMIQMILFAILFMFGLPEYIKTGVTEEAPMPRIERPSNAPLELTDEQIAQLIAPVSHEDNDNIKQGKDAAYGYKNRTEASLDNLYEKATTFDKSGLPIQTTVIDTRNVDNPENGIYSKFDHRTGELKHLKGELIAKVQMKDTAIIAARQAQYDAIGKDRSKAEELVKVLAKDLMINESVIKNDIQTLVDDVIDKRWTIQKIIDWLRGKHREDLTAKLNILHEKMKAYRPELPKSPAPSAPPLPSMPAPIFSDLGMEAPNYPAPKIPVDYDQAESVMRNSLAQPEPNNSSQVVPNHKNFYPGFGNMNKMLSQSNQ